MRPAEIAFATACSISRCELTPTIFRYFRMLKLKVSSFIIVSRSLRSRAAGLEQFYRVAGRVFDEHLLTSRARYKLTAEAHTGRSQPSGERSDIVGFDHQAVPPAGRRCRAVGKRSRSGASGPRQPQRQIATPNHRERR